MKITPINPPLRTGQTCRCCCCGEWTATLADLDGEAFKAFYCEGCRPDRVNEVRRLDENPENFYTFGTWVLVSDSFPTLAAAEDYVRRASSPTQKLRAHTRTKGT